MDAVQASHPEDPRMHKLFADEKLCRLARIFAWNDGNVRNHENIRKYCGSFNSHYKQNSWEQSLQSFFYRLYLNNILQKYIYRILSQILLLKII